MDDELIATIREALEGYAHHGAHFWPGAAAFLLIALHPDDMTMPTRRSSAGRAWAMSP